MNHSEEYIPLLTLLLGLSIVMSVLSKWGLQRLQLPASIGWLGIGIALRSVDSYWHWLDDGPHDVFAFLSTLGIACLLFRVGLQCHLQSLIAQLGRAIRIWIVDIAVSGGSAFVVSYYVLGLSLPTSLIIATALTATSVGVSVSAWQQRGRLQSNTGQLMLDVAELDDISGVVAMSLLFAVLPTLHAGGNGSLLPLLAETLSWFLLKLLVFGLICYLFSHFVEERLTWLLRRMNPPADPMLLIVAATLLIGALAEYLSLSIAVGAFLAGVMFSRDPQHVRIEASFDLLHSFFTPFFFIGIGLNVDLAAIPPVLGTGLLLSATAIFGKVAGKWVPGLQIDSNATALLLGFSMIPRAEIAMIIVQHGQQLGDWAMPPEVFGAMVLVSLTTCILSPLVVHRLLGRWPPIDAAADS
ncbi:MAG: cation:proton antiporter [Planctomycetota bacterium]